MKKLGLYLFLFIRPFANLLLILIGAIALIASVGIFIMIFCFGFRVQTLIPAIFLMALSFGLFVLRYKYTSALRFLKLQDIRYYNVNLLVENRPNVVVNVVEDKRGIQA